MSAIEVVLEATRDLFANRRRVLIGIDGPDAAGKTTIADSLATQLQSRVVRASVDDFSSKLRS